MNTVTITFHPLELVVGLFIGICIGLLVFCLVEMRNGGSWSQGFNDGCECKRWVDEIRKEKEERKNERTSTH